MKDNSWIKIGFGSVALLAVTWVLFAWLNPVSKNHYNPSKAYSEQQITNGEFSPPPNVNSKTRETQQATDKEIEQWRASRSDLAAQWKAADMSQLAFRIGVLGVILLMWTIVETLSAGKEMARQNDIALITAKAEYSPVISIVSFTVKFEGKDQFDEGGSKTGQIFIVTHCSDEPVFCKIEAMVTMEVKNWGKTPIYALRATGDVHVVVRTNIQGVPKGRFDPPRGFFTGTSVMIAPSETKKIMLKAAFKHIFGGDAQDNFFIPLGKTLIILEGSISFQDVFTLNDDSMSVREFFMDYQGWPDSIIKSEMFQTSPKELKKNTDI